MRANPKTTGIVLSVMSVLEIIYLLFLDKFLFNESATIGSVASGIFKLAITVFLLILALSLWRSNVSNSVKLSRLINLGYDNLSPIAQRLLWTIVLISCIAGLVQVLYDLGILANL